MTGPKPHSCHRGAALVMAAASVIAPAMAADLKMDEVQSAVETWVRYVTADARPDAAVEWLEPHVVDGRTVAYIAHLTGGGYCLCGADDLVLPVYLYRPFGTYNPNNPSYQYILEQISRRVGKLEESIARNSTELDQYEQVLSDRVKDWNDLIAGRVPEPNIGRGDRATPTIMTLRVDSNWHQHPPYNGQCPVLRDGLGEHVVVGCVATTAAQIMYYWKWPNTGTGIDSVEYYQRFRTDWDHQPLTTDPVIDVTGFWTDRLDWTVTDGLLHMSGVWDNSIYKNAQGKCNNGVNCSDADYLSALAALWGRMSRDTTIWEADFAATIYDWSDMHDNHADGDGVDDSEVAELCYHAGVAVGMRYGFMGSAAGLIRDGIVNYFRYDSDAVEVSRNVTSMVTEIQWLRPVEIAGKDPTGGGHSWTVAGYNTSTDPWEFLMNMGWGGGTTEWFSVDEVFPDNQENTIRIAPEGVVRFVGGGTPGDGAPATPYGDIDEALQEAPDGVMLVFKAGLENTFAGGSLVIDRPFTLKGYGATIQHE